MKSHIKSWKPLIASLEYVYECYEIVKKKVLTSLRGDGMCNSK